MNRKSVRYIHDISTNHLVGRMKFNAIIAELIMIDYENERNNCAIIKLI